MKKNIFSVFLAVLLSVSLLTVNCFAFDFNGGSRTAYDAYSEWLASMQKFLNGEISFDAWKKNNEQFQADIIGLNLFPSYGDDIIDKINDFQNQMNDIVDGTSTKIDDTIIDTISEIFSPLIPNFREQFEQWYQDTYGKKYGKHDNAFDVPFDKSTYSYYIKSDCGLYYHYYFFNSTQKVFDVTTLYGVKMIAVNGVTDGWLITKSKSSEYSSYDNSASYASNGNFPLEGSPTAFSTGLTISHNLPLNYWGDILNPDSTIDDPFSDLGGGSDEPPGLEPDEFLKFLEDLLLALENSKPDLSSVEGILRAIYSKCCEISNKISSSGNVQKLVAPINIAIEKLSEFFNKFIEIFGNFFEKLGEFFESIFVPSDDYISSTMLDIQAEFDEAFSFAGDLRCIVDTCICSYQNGGTNPPDITIDIDGSYKAYKLDFSIFNDTIDLVRSVLCAVVYATFAFNTYRRIPLYISGGGDR